MYQLVTIVGGIDTDTTMYRLQLSELQINMQQCISWLQLLVLKIQIQQCISWLQLPVLQLQQCIIWIVESAHTHTYIAAGFSVVNLIFCLAG